MTLDKCLCQIHCFLDNVKAYSVAFGRCSRLLHVFPLYIGGKASCPSEIIRIFGRALAIFELSFSFFLRRKSRKADSYQKMLKMGNLFILSFFKFSIK